MVHVASGTSLAVDTTTSISKLEAQLTIDAVESEKRVLRFVSRRCV